MRLFFDTNVLTYIAFFEGYLCEGTEGELESCLISWQELQLGQREEPFTLEGNLKKEIEALRTLYVIDDYAHFDWLFSDIALQEILSIRHEWKRSQHYNLLDRLIEHRNDVYEMEGRSVRVSERNYLLSAFFINLPKKMENDALQFCEAVLVEADYFVTNDERFIRASASADLDIARSSFKIHVASVKPSQLVSQLRPRKR
jgi:hypothetical protein